MSPAAPAAALALPSPARQVPFALGTDTGGSIRIPAALNGVTGLRPTFGRVPKDRTAVVGYSLDTVGPLCLTAEDTGFVLNVIAGYTPDDPALPVSLPRTSPPICRRRAIRGRCKACVSASWAATSPAASPM